MKIKLLFIIFLGIGLFSCNESTIDSDTSSRKPNPISSFIGDTTIEYVDGTLLVQEDFNGGDNAYVYKNASFYSECGDVRVGSVLLNDDALPLNGNLYEKIEKNTTMPLTQVWNIEGGNGHSGFSVSFDAPPHMKILSPIAMIENNGMLYYPKVSNNGFTITWEGQTDDKVFIEISHDPFRSAIYAQSQGWEFPLSSNPDDNIPKTIRRLVPDNGSYTFSKDDFDNLAIIDGALFEVTIVRVKYKIIERNSKKYAVGTISQDVRLLEADDSI